MSDSRLPEKEYFRIGEVARIVGVKTSVLRFWETEFPSVRPQKSRSNQRLYARRHVQRLLHIKALLYDQGFTIAGARRRLNQKGELEGAEAAVEANGDAHKIMSRVKKELQELLQLLDE